MITFISKRNKTIFTTIKVSMNNSILKVYTDGACTNNGKSNAKCSIGIHFPETNFKQIPDVSKFLNVSKSSNNVAELTAIKAALEIIREYKILSQVNLYTDSMYSKNTIEKWYPSWVKQNIVHKKKNSELITELYKVYSAVNEHNNINLVYIKAHTGFQDEDSIGNSIADELATNALKKFDFKTNDIKKYFK
jgi:ribonuclease HI